MTDNSDYQPAIERRIRNFTVRGVDYVVNEWGDESAPLIFYLHGWGDTGSTFQFVADHLADSWFVVAPDWRGFGRTEFRAPTYWFPDYVADLHHLLSVYSPDSPAKLIGHSMGANIGSLYSGAVPERVKSFVNIEGFGLPDSDPTDAPGRYRKWIEEGSVEQRYSDYADFSELALKIRKRSPEMSEGAAEFVAREWAALGDDGVVRICADPNHKLPNAVLYRRAEAEACWKQITARTLLVSGGASNFAEQFGLSSLLPFPDAETVSIDGAGHMIHFERPAELAAEIDRFFRQDL